MKLMTGIVDWTAITMKNGTTGMIIPEMNFCFRIHPESWMTLDWQSVCSMQPLTEKNMRKALSWHIYCPN
jgi:hypothetical protein